LIDKPFYCTFGAESNGRYSVINGMDRFLESYPGLDRFEYCPMRIEAVQNSLWRDFEAMKSIEPKLAGFNIDTVGYCLSIYREILVKELFGSILDTKQMKLEWHQYVSTLDQSTRDSIDEGMKLLAEREKKNTLLRKTLNQLGIFDKAKVLYRKGKANINRISGKTTTYKNVMDAVASTDHYIAS